MGVVTQSDLTRFEAAAQTQEKDPLRCFRLLDDDDVEIPGGSFMKESLEKGQVVDIDTSYALTATPETPSEDLGCAMVSKRVHKNIIVEGNEAGRNRLEHGSARGGVFPKARDKELSLDDAVDDRDIAVSWTGTGPRLIPLAECMES